MNDKPDNTIQTEPTKSLQLTARLNDDKTCECRMDVYGSPAEPEKVAMLQGMAFSIISDLLIFMPVTDLSRMVVEMMTKALEKLDPEQAETFKNVRTAARRDAAMHSIPQYHRRRN